MTSMDGISVENAGGVLNVRLNRPDCGNLITMAMIEALTETLHRLPDDVKTVVLSGSGEDFCRGRDYTTAPEDQRPGKAPTAADIRRHMTSPILAMYSTIKELAVPTVSVVQGNATGFGCAMAGCCDIVLASEDARFSLPEMRERGLPPTLAMTALLDRIAYHALTYLVYSTAPLSAEDARKAGLVSAVYPRGELDAAAQDVIAGIAAQPLECVRAVKQYFMLAPTMEPRGRGALGGNLFAVSSASRT